MLSERPHDERTNDHLPSRRRSLQQLLVGAGGGVFVLVAIVIIAVMSSKSAPEKLEDIVFSRR